MFSLPSSFVSPLLSPLIDTVTPEMGAPSFWLAVTSSVTVGGGGGVQATIPAASSSAIPSDDLFMSPSSESRRRDLHVARVRDVVVVALAERLAAALPNLLQRERGSLVLVA